VLSKMREWFALYYPNGLMEYEDHPERWGASRLDRTDFYLSSSEVPGLWTSRSCQIIATMRGPSEADSLLLVRIDPPVASGILVRDGSSVDEVLIATTETELTLAMDREARMVVQVGRLLIPYGGQATVRDDEIQWVGHAQLTPTKSG
jgi:hypothetical protein